MCSLTNLSPGLCNQNVHPRIENVNILIIQIKNETLRNSMTYKNASSPYIKWTFPKVYIDDQAIMLYTNCWRCSKM